MPNDFSVVPDNYVTPRNNFVEQDSGSSILPCGQTPVPCYVPCDIASLTIEDTGSSISVGANISASSDPNVTGKEKKYLQGDDLYIEVIAGPDGLKDSTPAEVDILAELSPSCGASHHLESQFYAPSHADDSVTANITNGMIAKKELFSAPMDYKKQTLALFFGRFFDFYDHASDYSVQTLSCGLATNGEGTTFLRGTVRAMTADTWEIKLKMPARKERSYKRVESAGLKEGRTSSREYVTKTDWGKTTVGDSQSESSGVGGAGAGSKNTEDFRNVGTLVMETDSDGETKYSVQQTEQSGLMSNTVTTESGGTSKITKRELAPKIRGMPVGLSVSHNGEEFEVLDGINKMLELVQTITDLAEKMIPKIQFGWGFEFKFVEIGLYAQWGRIAKQTTVGSRVAILERDALVGLSGTFIFIEASFGLEGQACGFGLIAKIAVSGQLDATIEWTIGEGKVTGGVTGTIKGAGTGEIFLDSMFFKGGYKLLIESNLIGKWEITASEAGWSDSASVTWSGVHFYRIKTGFAKGKDSKPTEWAEEKILMEPRSVFTG